MRREDPRAGVGCRNGLNWVCILGRRRSSGLRSSLAAETAPPFPPCRQHLRHLPALSLTPSPPWGRLPLRSCKAEAALGEDQKEEAPFPFTHFVQRLPLPRLHMPPGSWLLVTALHRRGLFFCVLGDPPHCPQGPLVSPAPSPPPLWTNFLSLLFSVLFQQASFSEPLTPSFSLCPGQFCLFHVICGFVASMLLRATQR